VRVLVAKWTFSGGVRFAKFATRRIALRSLPIVLSSARTNFAQAAEKKMRSMLVGLSILGSASTGLAGGSLQAIEVVYKPLVMSDRGRIGMCGVHISAAATDGIRSFVWQGSLNNMFKDEQLPVFVFKTSVMEIENDTLVSKAVPFAYIRTGRQSTAEFAQSPSDDPASFLAYGWFPGELEDAYAFVDTVITEGAQVGFDIGEGSDFTFFIGSTDSTDVAIRFGECMIHGIEQQLQ